MLAWVLLVANMPTIVCTICSAFLAYKERPQWVWFAGLAVLAGIGGLLTRRARTTARMAIVSEKGRTPSSLVAKLVFVRSDLDVHQGRFFGL